MSTSRLKAWMDSYPTLILLILSTDLLEERVWEECFIAWKNIRDRIVTKVTWKAWRHWWQWWHWSAKENSSLNHRLAFIDKEAQKMESLKLHPIARPNKDWLKQMSAFEKSCLLVSAMVFHAVDLALDNAIVAARFLITNWHRRWTGGMSRIV